VKTRSWTPLKNFWKRLLGTPTLPTVPPLTG